MANEFQQGPQQGPQPGFQPGPQPGPQPGFQPMGAGTPQLTIQEAIQRATAGLTKFEGRSRRSEFWWWTLVVGVGSWVLGLIIGVFGHGASIILGGLVQIATSAAMLAVTIRRLQDTGKPGVLAWILYGMYALIYLCAILIYLLPLGGITVALATIVVVLGILSAILGIVILIFCILDSTPGVNKYGPSEKYPA